MESKNDVKFSDIDEEIYIADICFIHNICELDSFYQITKSSKMNMHARLKYFNARLFIGRRYV